MKRPCPTPQPPNWYPDPFGRHELRWYDGAVWTDHVSSGGRQSIDQPVGPGTVPTVARPTEKIQRDVQRAGAAGFASGGGTILTEPILVVNQKAKLVEVNSEYAVFDQHGNQLGAVRQVGQSTGKKVARALFNVDALMTHHLQVVDAAGSVVLSLTKPRSFVRPQMVVSDPAGNQVGAIVTQLRLGKAKFKLMVGEHQVGELNAENFRAWNFGIFDASGAEVARITKTWEGMAKAMFTTADNYVIQVHRPLEEPLRSLVVASGVAVDQILKQTQS